MVPPEGRHTRERAGGSTGKLLAFGPMRAKGPCLGDAFSVLGRRIARSTSYEPPGYRAAMRETDRGEAVGDTRTGLAATRTGRQRGRGQPTRGAQSKPRQAPFFSRDRRGQVICIALAHGTEDKPSPARDGNPSRYVSHRARHTTLRQSAVSAWNNRAWRIGHNPERHQPF